MLCRPLFLVILLLLHSLVFGANFYKCESSDGNVTFSDKPCPTKSTTTQKGKLNSFRITGSISKNEFPDDKPNRDENAALIFRAKFSGILQSLTPLRRSIAQYFMERGEWPDDMKALGFDQQSMQSQHIDSVRIKKNGKLVALLNARLGEHKIIILNPKPAMGATSIDWQCWSNFPRSLLGGGELEICGSREIY